MPFRYVYWNLGPNLSEDKLTNWYYIRQLIIGTWFNHKACQSLRFFHLFNFHFFLFAGIVLEI